MKKKYLLAAATLPLMFSCTQDDFTVSGVDNDAYSLQDRISVGQVAFTTGDDDGADTRLDFATGQWENGDKFRLFLMDEYDSSCDWGSQENGEANNANETHFMEQEVWNNMYTISNRLSSNFPFVYNSQTGAWENDDAIVEGNWFAVKPATGGQQSDLLDGVRNRRDVWVYINPVQKYENIEKGTALFDGVEENQFFLGYTQVYRTDDATTDNVLQLPIQMRPILANIDLIIQNVSSLPFKVEKMTISRADGQPMPTLAYIRPCNNTPSEFGTRQDDGEKYFTQQWSKVPTDASSSYVVTENDELCLGHTWQEPAWQNTGYLNFGPAFAQPYVTDNTTDACGVEDTDYYWTRDSWTRTAARSVVYYSYPGEEGYTPYECTGDAADIAYEYVIDFTNEDGEGIELNTNEYIQPIFVLPHDMDMSEYVFTVYGQQYQNDRDGWVNGVIVPRGNASDGVSNPDVESDGKFTLPGLDPTVETDYIAATIMFDAFYPITLREVQVSNAADLLKYIESYYSAGNTNSQLFYVTTLGDFEVTQELVDYVEDLNGDYSTSKGGKALVYFKETKNGSVIFPAGLSNSNAIDLFYYSKKAEIVNKGTQIITKSIVSDYGKSINDFYTSLTEEDWWTSYGDDVDYATTTAPALADLSDGGIGTITNEGNLTLENVVIDLSNDSENIVNEEGATLNMVNSVLVEGNSENGVYVHNKGTFSMEASYIGGTLKNDNEASIASGTNYIGTLLNYNDCINCQKGAAQLTVAEDATLNVTAGGSNGESTNTYEGQIDNYGVFNFTGTSDSFTNYSPALIVNGSSELAGTGTKVKMTGVTNRSGKQAEAVKLDNGAYMQGIINYCDLSVTNYGYIYNAVITAQIEVFNDYIMDDINNSDTGSIENTVHGNIYCNNDQYVTSYQMVIYTVDEETADIVDIVNAIEKYYDYNKVVLKVGTLTCSDASTNSKLYFNNKDGNKTLWGEVEFASDETLVNADTEWIHLAVDNVKVDGVVRLMHSTKMRVGQYDPNIDCTVYGDGSIYVQNNTTLSGMGANDRLECTTYVSENATLDSFEVQLDVVHTGI